MKRLVRMLAVFALAVVCGAPGWAADAPYKAGDKVEYRASRFPEKWEAGVVIRILPGGTQALIREKPSQFYPEGFERAYALDELRRPGATPKAPAPAPGAGGGGKPVPPPKAAGPPLTQAEVGAYLRANLGDTPFGPNRAAVLQALAAMIKQRGVAFRYEAIGNFSKEVARYSLTSEVTAPLGYNYGPPTGTEWLMGTWRMDKVGAAIYYVKNGDLYRQGEMGARMGSLTIRADGAYVWQLYANDPPAKHVRGRWRKATADEMRYQGGEGIVLLKAKSGEDWLVRHDRTAPQGEWVTVSHVVYWGQREFGLRMPAAPAPRAPRRR